jgi:hypothetical protein
LKKLQFADGIRCPNNVPHLSNSFGFVNVGRSDAGHVFICAVFRSVFLNSEWLLCSVEGWEDLSVLISALGCLVNFAHCFQKRFLFEGPGAVERSLMRVYRTKKITGISSEVLISIAKLQSTHLASSYLT